MSWRYFTFTEDEANTFFEIFGEVTKAECEAYKEIYTELGSRKQGELGYVLARMQAEQGAFSPYQAFCWDCLLKRDFIKVPFKFCGWAGEHNDIGPAYQICNICLGDGQGELFYTDDDIKYDKEAAIGLAKLILQESSGLSGFSIVKMGYDEDMALEKKDTDLIGWVIFFKLDETRIKDEVTVNGISLNRNESGGYIFVLPKAGEFGCVFGELVGGSAMLPLARHLFCMK